MTWIFGYGSLMWDPGFRHEAREPARLQGYHRTFCTVSTNNRGTPESPGMMMGLMPGGGCTGVAFRVLPEHLAETLAYLTEREGEGRSNREVILPVAILARPGKVFVNAHTYLPIVSQPNYVGLLPLAELLPRFSGAPGKKGTSYEYLVHTLKVLTNMGEEEPLLRDLLERIDSHRRNSVAPGRSKVDP